jgi:hypothetical protein
MTSRGRAAQTLQLHFYFFLSNQTKITTAIHFIIILQIMESTFASVQDVCSALNEQAHFQNAGAALLREQKRIALMQLKVHTNTGGLIPSGKKQLT